MKINSREEFEKKVLEFEINKINKIATPLLNYEKIIYGDIKLTPLEMELINFFKYKNYKC